MSTYLKSIERQWQLWLTTPAGKRLLEFEYHKVLPVRFSRETLTCIGYDGLALQQSLVICNEFSNLSSNNQIIASFDKLPLPNNCLSSIWLPHCLEFSADPIRVLTEVYRVLRPEGKIYITGFSGFSWWGLWQPLMKLMFKMPWRVPFQGMTRTRLWVLELGFEELQVVKRGLLPWNIYTKNLPCFANFFGTVYCLSATKVTLGFHTRIPHLKMKLSKLAI